MKVRSILGFSSLLLLFSCAPDMGEANLSEYRRPDLPEHESQYIQQVEDPSVNRLLHMGSEFNPTTNEGITLGRVLFYDKKLSINNSISCGSCHQQNKAFSDGMALSKGFQGNITTRSSMPLSNLWEESNYFWDGRKTTLESVVLGPVKDHVEMGFDRMDFLEAKLSHFDYYPSLFEKAFGSPEITEEKISKALSQFLRALGSNKSRVENLLLNMAPSLTPLELKGFEVFNNKGMCGSCHLLPGQSWFGPGDELTPFIPFSPFENTGLDATITDPGAGNGMFKVPSLRNVALTAPYMHDGRFNTLEEVVEFYNSGVKANPFLSWTMREEASGFGMINGNNFQPKRLHLTSDEKASLVAFLKAFTDETYIKDPALSDPFK